MWTDGEQSLRKPLARVGPEGRDPVSLWTIILAGGEGVRLRPLTRRICGDDRPKQYVPLLEARSLLGQTLDRAARISPPERTVVVTQRRHSGYIADEFRARPAPRVLIQPDDRGTAAGVLLPAHWIRWRDPEAVVAVFPADHLILEEDLFARHVSAVAGYVTTHPERIVLLGARATEPETEYGWIEPGEPLGVAGGEPIFEVRRFREKPSPEGALACLQAGSLWSTFVMVAKASALVAAGARCLPVLHERLAGIERFAGSEHEPWAIHQAYAYAPRASFSRAVLEACPSLLAVSRLPALTWCDLGSPERVMRTLASTGLAPAWLAALGEPA